MCYFQIIVSRCLHKHKVHIYNVDVSIRSPLYEELNVPAYIFVGIKMAKFRVRNRIPINKKFLFQVKCVHVPWSGRAGESPAGHVVLAAAHEQARVPREGAGRNVTKSNRYVDRKKSIR